MRICIRLLCIVRPALLSAMVAATHVGGAAAADLKILTEENPPLNFLKDGEVTGLATEVAREIARRTGTVDNIQLVDWHEGYQALLEQPDVALYSTVMNRQRKPLAQWVGPVVSVETNLYALKDADIRIANLEDAKNADSIATVVDYYSEQLLKAEGFANTRSVPDRVASVRHLLNGEVQLVASANTELPAALEKAGASMHDVKNVFTLSTDLAYIAFSKGTSPELVARWQSALDDMKRDGTFARIYARWLPGEMPPGEFQLVTEEYPPVTFLQGGRPSGLVTDMVRQIGARLGIHDSIRLTSWKNAFNMGLTYPKVVLFSAERTPEREGLFHWVGPVGRNSAILYARKGSGITIGSIEEARKVAVIATTTNWFTEQALQREGFRNLRSSPDPRDNVRQLMKREAQLSVFTDLTIAEIAREAGYDVNDLEPVLTVGQTYFYIALSRDTPVEQVQAWQGALDELKRDGSFEKIYRHYVPTADLRGLVP